MKGLGQKFNSQARGLGVKHKSLAYTLGSKQIIPHLVSNLISPNKPIVSGISKNQLIPNVSNSSKLQYLPTGMKQSYLEKRRK